MDSTARSRHQSKGALCCEDRVPGKGQPPYFSLWLFLTSAFSLQGVLGLLIEVLQKQLQPKADLFDPKHPFPFLPPAMTINELFTNPPTAIELRMACMAQAIGGGNSRGRGELHPSGPPLPTPNPTTGTIDMSSALGGALGRFEALERHTMGGLGGGGRMLTNIEIPVSIVEGWKLKKASCPTHSPYETQNMLATAPPTDQNSVATYLQSLTTRDLTSLAQNFSQALRECGSPG